MSRAGARIDSEILLVKFIVKIIHFFRRHSKIRTEKMLKFTSQILKNFITIISFYLHLLLYVVKKVVSKKTFFENFKPGNKSKYKEKIWHLSIFHTEILLDSGKDVFRRYCHLYKVYENYVFSKRMNVIWI